MRTSFLFALIFLSTNLFSDPLHVEITLAPGYRSDQFTTKLTGSSGETLYEEKFEKGHSAVEALSLQLSWDRWRLEFAGSFGWLVEAEGKVNSRLSSTVPLTFQVKNYYGYEADGSTLLGYDLPLYRYRFFTLEFTPLVGVGYQHIATRTKGILHDDIQDIVGFNADVTYTEPNLNHADLWGPSIEGRIGLLFRDVVDIHFFYQYRFIYLRQVLDDQLLALQEPGAPVLTSTEIISHKVVHNNLAASQIGGFDVHVETLNHVLFGVKAYGGKVYTSHASARDHQVTTAKSANTVTVTDIKSAASFDWTIYAAIFYFGYGF